MQLSKDLKPLIANLKRLEVGHYLCTKQFEHFVLEHDFDESWNAACKETKSRGRVVSIGHYDPEEEENAFALLISYLYRYEKDDFAFFILEFIIEFCSWADTPLDYRPLYQNLKDLDIYKKSTLISFLQDIKSTQQKKAPTTTPVPETQKSSINPKKVFIVHGHAEKARLQLCSLLEKEFKLEPVVLQDQPNDSFDTIISKFERLASDCGLVIVLLTPDDVTESFTRARQNVIFELGYFLGKFQNASERKIIVIKNGKPEIPSDINGVLYLKFHDNVDELYLPLQKQLSHWNIL